MPTWYYMSNLNERIGPLEDAALRQAIAAGVLQADSPVFKVGNNEWNRAKDFPTLFQIPPAPPVGISELPWSVKEVVNADGAWGSELRFPDISAHEHQILSGLLQKYMTAQSPPLPKVSATADGGGLVFVFPPTTDEGKAALANTPMESGEVEALRVSLLRTAVTLHRHGLGLWVVEQRLLFRADGQYLLAPSFWFPAFAGRGGTIAGTAPEWRDVSSQPQADIYAIACACFTAITRKEYDPATQLLPGDLLPSAKAWDAVLDPALRQNPTRRPKSIDEWLTTMPFAPVREIGAPVATQPDDTASGIREQYREQRVNANGAEESTAKPVENTFSNNIERRKKPHRKKKRKFPRIIAALVLLAIVAAIVNHFLSMTGIEIVPSIIPSASSGYKRGFGSTVLSYATPSYKSASWKEVWNVNAAPGNYRAMKHISGWDKDNLAVLMDGQYFVWKRSGEWIVTELGMERIATSICLIFESVDKIFISTTPGIRRITPISNDAFTNDHWAGVTHHRQMGNFDTNMVFFSSGSPYVDDCHLFANNKLEYWGPNEQRRYVFKGDGLYADEKRATLMQVMVSPSRGKLVGIQKDYPISSTAQICVFENNRWTLLHELRNFPESSIQCLWASSDDVFAVGTGKGLVIVRNGVLSKPVINIAGYSANQSIIAVWGKDSSHYYMMDIGGNIVEFDGTQFRILARGPELKNREEFNAAWVSPEGCVFAITNEKVYCFE